MAEPEKRVRRKPERFAAFKEGDKLPPMAVRSEKSKKKRKQRDKNANFQKSKKQKNAGSDATIATLVVEDTEKKDVIDKSKKQK